MARTSPEKLPNHTPARRRGRPLGSAPYRKADEKLLARYADKAIHNTGLELAPFARAAGVSQPATIRRLQARWRGDRERFLKDAQNRFDARRPESPWQILVDLYEGLRRMSRMLSREVLDPLSASIQKAERRWNALGKSARLPFDPTDPSELKPALARFENAMPTPGSNEIDGMLGDQTLADLPGSLRLYLLAVLMHEASLIERRRETEASPRTRGDRNGERP